jgi:anti-sigma28 factor (negative regulator of flagellin synthesis)
MKIDDSGMTGASAAGLGAAGLDRAQKAQEIAGQVKGAAGAAGDEVNLSTLAERLRSLDTVSAERDARIQRLAAAFDARSYEADAEAVAEGLISEAADEGLGG